MCNKGCITSQYLFSPGCICMTWRWQRSRLKIKWVTHHFCSCCWWCCFPFSPVASGPVMVQASHFWSLLALSHLGLALPRRPPSLCPECGSRVKVKQRVGTPPSANIFISTGLTSLSRPALKQQKTSSLVSGHCLCPDRLWAAVCVCVCLCLGVCVCLFV